MWGRPTKKLFKTSTNVMGLEQSVLDYVIDLVHQRFQHELAKPYHPDHFMVRAMPTGYFPEDLTDGISFEEAVNHWHSIFSPKI